MRVAIFITVRFGSSRLPGKALLPLNGLPTLLQVINRAKACELADRIVVCTTDLAEDDKIEALALESGVSVTRGSVEDKLVRWLKACEENDVDGFITFDADDLLVDPKMADIAIEQLRAESADFIECSQCLPGAFTYAVRTSALKKVCEVKASNNTEMMWHYFKALKFVRCSELNWSPTFDNTVNARITLDYEEDFQFFKVVYRQFQDSHEVVSLDDALLWLADNPEVIAINIFRDLDWSSNQTAKAELAIKEEFLHFVREEYLNELSR